MRYQMEESILMQFHGRIGIPGLGVGSREGADAGLKTLRGLDVKFGIQDVIGLPEDQLDTVDVHSAMEKRLHL